MNQDYFENERPEIVELVDSSAKVILDVGCGAGRLGARLKTLDSTRTIYGIEHNESAAAKAEQVLDRVFVGDVQTVDLPLQNAQVDCMIFADILEHLAHPEKALAKLRPLLRPDGFIIASIPNMRHYTVILRLITTGWRYEEFGLFDKTHLRYFSRGTMGELLSDAGFVPDIVAPRVVASKKMRILNFFLFGMLEEFLAMQYIIKAHPRKSNED